MACDENAEFIIDGGMSVGALVSLIEQNYRFALDTDFSDRRCAGALLVRLGGKARAAARRAREDDGADREQPLGIARDVAALYRALADA